MADRSILIVDDNEINRGILAEIFKDKFNILETGDIVMPEMDGYAVLEEMGQRDNLNETIPVLMITADTSTEAERASYQRAQRTLFTSLSIRSL